MRRHSVTVREIRDEGFDKVESLGRGKGGGTGGGEGGTFLQKGSPFPPPIRLYFFTGTVEMALNGEPSTMRRLTAR